MVRSNRIRSRAKTNGQCDGQRRIDKMLGPRGKEKESDTSRKLRLSRERLATVRRKLESEESRLVSGLSFQQILDEKHNRNNLGVHLSYLGVSKLQKLISRGISTGIQLLECAENGDPSIKWR